jgi:hypothetical protein
MFDKKAHKHDESGDERVSLDIDTQCPFSFVRLFCKRFLQWLHAVSRLWSMVWKLRICGEKEFLWFCSHKFTNFHSCFFLNINYDNMYDTKHYDTSSSSSSSSSRWENGAADSPLKVVRSSSCRWENGAVQDAPLRVIERKEWALDKPADEVLEEQVKQLSLEADQNSATGSRIIVAANQSEARRQTQVRKMPAGTAPTTKANKVAGKLNEKQKRVPG